MINQVKRVLVVDDNPTFRRAIVMLLQQKGYEAIVADNGQDGLTVAADRAPHLILLDVAMPVMDGLSFLRALRQLPGAARDVPVILMTAMSERDYLTGAEDVQVQGYLLKSRFSLAQAAALIAQTLATAATATAA